MSQFDGLDLDLLEPLLRDWVRLIGLEPTMKIAQAYGGTLLYIAQAADENADLVALIGRENAATLGRHYGGERPLVPKALPALRALRDARMRALRGVTSHRQLARQHGIGERRARQILAAADGTDDGSAGPANLPLFD